jgi:hypothetical protein
MNIRISDDVVFRDLAGEAVILNLATGTYFGLDSVGTREGQLRRDLDGLTRQLMDKGLVRTDAEETSPAG